MPAGSPTRSEQARLGSVVSGHCPRDMGVSARSPWSLDLQALVGRDAPPSDEC